MRGNITKTSIKALPKPAKGKRVILWDADHREVVPGFCVRKSSGGTCTFYYVYGKQREFVKLGTFPPTTPEEARGKARIHSGGVEDGADPAGERRRERAIPDWRTWVATYLERIEARKKKRAAEGRQGWGFAADRRYLLGTGPDDDLTESEAMARWGGRRLDKITAPEVEALVLWHRDRGAETIAQRIAKAREAKDEARAKRNEAIPNPGATVANRALASIRSCFAAAVREGYVVSNPAEAVAPLSTNPPRQRVLTDGELANLRGAVAELKDPEERALMVLLLDTACRVSEALSLRWEHVDLEHGEVTLLSPKSGHVQALALPWTTAGELRALDRRSPWCFPSPVDPNRPRAGIRSLWQRLCVSAKITGANLHDVRRTVGLRIARRAGLHVASRVLRHSDVRVTAKTYAPLGVGELREAMEAVITGTNVVPIERE